AAAAAGKRLQTWRRAQSRCGADRGRGASRRRAAVYRHPQQRSPPGAGTSGRRRPAQLSRALERAVWRCGADAAQAASRCSRSFGHAAVAGAPRMMRVLVADDEAPARGKLQRWLSEQADIEVVAESQDGLGAAEAIERLKPDVVFLDIQMPGLSGLEVAAQLEQETAPLIVFVTAFDEHAIKAFELNAIDYLLKPYDKDRLLKTLSRIRARPADGSTRAAAVARSVAGTGGRDAATHRQRDGRVARGQR